MIWKLSPHNAGALLGKNQYKTPTQALAYEFKRQCSGPWKAAMDALNVEKTSEELGTEEFSKHPELAVLLKETVETSTKESRDTFNKAVSKALSDGKVGEKRRRDTENAARKLLYTSQGIRNESESLHSWFSNEEEEKGVFDDLVDPVTHKTPFFKLKLKGGVMWGKFDGIFKTDDGETVLVEAKERQNRLLGETDYERVQVFVYMKMLNVKRAKILETFEKTTVKHEIVWVDEEWEIYEKGLTECIVKLNKALIDMEYRKQLAKSLIDV